MPIGVPASLSLPPITLFMIGRAERFSPAGRFFNERIFVTFSLEHDL